MFRNRIFYLLLALAMMLPFAATAKAAEVDSDSIYCFSPADFSSDEALTGICITHLPDSAAGTVLLASRVLQPGDILTTQQLAQMTFQPLRTDIDASAAISYLPIYADHVAPSATMTLSIRGKTDAAPIAEDSVMETYKNIPNETQLKVTDPEGQPLTYTLVRQPKRGEVILRKDGSILYTPKKNKVGVDSFTFTATDPAGNVSREATVTIQIIKPTDAAQYTDTLGRDCRFAAEWMRNTGLFVGESISGEACFRPDKSVSQGEFVAMVIKTLEIPMDTAVETVGEDIPQWLKPYMAAALRSGLTEGISTETGSAFDAPITSETAATMLQNALDLAAPTAAGDADQVWTPMDILASNGISLAPGEVLTRGQVANILYQVAQLAEEAPGTVVFRIQQ